MKFSISFKYSNVTFKNKETKEVISYDSKAETGNTFTFDNVDEDVVLGMVKGIKDKKASQVFAYDDFRTNFVNVMARNKCKELYDKLDKGGWKVEDITISNITIKDLEFTKPTMNAREVITVESRKSHKGNTIFIRGNWYDYGESGTEKIKVDDISAENIKHKVQEFCNRKWNDAGVHCDSVYVEVFADFIPNSKPVFLFDGRFSYGKVEWYEDDGEEHRWIEGIYMERKNKARMNEDLKDTIHKESREDLVEVITKACKEIDIISNMYDVSDTAFEKLQDVRTMLLKALPSTDTAKKMNESKEEVEVEFKKTPDDGTVIAFFPETMHDGSCNPGNIMSYEHNGQHGEASIDFYKDCTPCMEKDYASLLHELEGIYDDCKLVVVEK